MTKAHIPTILVVDDDENILQVLEARLLSTGLNPLMADRAETALEMLACEPVDLVVSDVKMPGMGGHGLLREILEHWPHIPVIMLTAHGTIPDAVGSIQAGAADYLTKPFDGKELVRRIRAILEAGPPDRGAPPCARDASAATASLWGGEAPAMARFLSLLDRVARSTAGVLLFGESGTGKELAARILHEASPRAGGPFVVVDCGSTQPTLLESELFGHVKGAFTHALKDKKGLIEEADGGTLFLDEIGNISPEMQTRLLRFLQEGTIRRVGDTRERSVACRVVAATNANLPEKVRAGQFREDLYYRLKVVTLTIPPLRERAEDIPVLARGFVRTMCNEQGRPEARLSAKGLERLKAHPWPGNVRELKHALEAALVFCQCNTLEADDIQLDPIPEGSPASNAPLSLDESEKQAIIRALALHGGVRKDAADALGISRRAIHYKIRKYGIGSDHD
ncbi:MAG: sigma-54 dependent transcriptional regulator [Pseudodesulfovibrio sp.]|uniref:Sigma-54 factor interaction domain-containing protein n=1 Tax=Pseudodesulfovibrio aespoeensis (strain ATCC 700646 / DSM 10631 / Aspo-2) TaxID=643562 RepID=E6VV11_PSEA9|nr:MULTISPECIES: sigma-54 dependent transcriptional regulator [Pseudodesulfovibrio]MBU4191442.1 sigma-54 dependent transcriptional regulator [Pseudomonadota bacterium]ADU63519.1 sigma-54 factor interaction domain-containing protein [Pseudodesulfovibrio aespoeensis Aspo-2]MBU4244874.1 sigma-54 dependent transcriptional regulator [Pseudomonadota bacterium]MBU4380079.1 sigma-54 dependent transcriptional regulator [Pseudomonadota bacterium]MBU4475749.1 sigma-54 dependent transcriptional regulator 